MKIKISKKRSVIGFDITVDVTADGTERIKYVYTRFDGRRIGHKVCNPPVLSYSNTFVQVGGYAPGLRHEVFVSAISTVGRDSTILEWQDQ